MSDAGFVENYSGAGGNKLMTYEEYERVIYAEVAWSEKRDAICRALSGAIANRSSNWEGWPGSLWIANIIMQTLEP